MSARRVLKAIAILMLLVTPLRLAAGGAATASPHNFEVAMTLGHCDGGEKSQKGQTRPHNHCSMAVPGIPTGSDGLLASPGRGTMPQAVAHQAFGSGLGPEARTPPPRHS